MEKVLLNELKEKILIRSALIPISGLEELLNLNDYLSPDQILFGLFEKALRDFEFYHPLVWEFRVSDQRQLGSCETMGEGYCEIKDNFELYLKCMIDLSQVLLVPNSTPLLRPIGSYPSAGNYFYPLDYNKPYINLSNWFNQGFYMKGLYSRPIIGDFNPDKTFSNKAAIYFMDIKNGMKGNKFVDMCVMTLLEHLRNLKFSLTLPNFPIDILANIDVSYQQLKSELDNYFLQSGWDGSTLL